MSVKEDLKTVYETVQKPIGTTNQLVLEYLNKHMDLAAQMNKAPTGWDAYEVMEKALKDAPSLETILRSNRRIFS